MKETKRNNPAVNWQISGTGDVVLFFVHGAFTDQSYWTKQVAYFDRKYTVVTMDLPGHGKSGKERTQWDVENFAEDVSFVIQQLNLKNVVLIGHGFGANISLMVAIQHPAHIIGFIAIDSFKNAGTPLSPNYQQQADAIIENSIKDFPGTMEQYARVALLRPSTPSRISERVIKDYRHAWQPMGAAVIKAEFEKDQLEKRLLPGLQPNLHLINADYTPTNEAALKNLVKSGYDLAVIKGTSHFPMIENPAELNRLLELAIYKIEHADAVY
ncbi:MAG: alpha/beta hydrolase [Ferruginibacter sp.]|uniref:alpha/beta fold hydrolase n=1 Tax=Ferruginibacter sp. TaxID=1940288 RepID=UPI0026597274|nr:alpha/beta hydrolase [Ferruginibacter sp.]MDB5278258.1 alpha/beta hydrolase [Ferruginibacter sp.]